MIIGIKLNILGIKKSLYSFVFNNSAENKPPKYKQAIVMPNITTSNKLHKSGWEFLTILLCKKFQEKRNKWWINKKPQSIKFLEFLFWKNHKKPVCLKS